LRLETGYYLHRQWAGERGELEMVMGDGISKWREKEVAPYSLSPVSRDRYT